MTSPAGFPGLPPNPTLADIRRVVNAALVGGLNIGGVVQLTAGDETTVQDGRVSGASLVLLEAANEDAALLKQTTSVYVPEADRAKGSFKIMHAGAAGTERFYYLAIS